MPILLFALTGTLLVGPGDEAVGDAMKAIQGKWEVYQVSTDGRRETEEQVKARKMSFEFKGNRHVIRAYGGVDEDGTFALDPARSPKRLDLAAKPGTVSTKAIYELDGDALRIAYFLFSEERPAGFEENKEKKVLVLRVYVARRLKS
jgi:uncharacterized protein (TIGR03067 family)